MEDKVLFESKHCIALKCVLFLFYGGLGCIYPFLQSNMAEKGFDFNEIYSISAIIPIVALFGPLIFALLVDKWAISSAFAYGKRVRILTAVSLVASIILYVILMFGVSRTPPPEVCHPEVNFMCNKKGAYILQEKCSAEGVCHDWDYNKAGLLNLDQCSYSCQREAQFESNCYERQDQELRLAAFRNSEVEDDGTDVADESELVQVDEGSGRNTGGNAKSNDLDGDGIPNDQDPDDDNDGIPDSQDNDDDNDGVPDAEDLDDDNDGVPDSMDPDSKMTANDLDGDGIPNDQDEDDDNDGIPDALDDDDDNDGVPDAQDDDDDNDGIPDSADSDAKSKGNDLDGDGIPNDKDDDDDNDGIPDIIDTDDDNDGVPDRLDSDDDNDGIPDTRDKDAVSKPNDLDGDGIPNEEDDDDDNDGIPDKDDDDDDNDGILDVEDVDDDNDGIPDDQEGKPLTNDLDGDGIPNDLDDDDDNDGIPDSEDDDDDNDGIPDAEDIDDDNDGIPDELDEGSRNANDLDGDGIPNDLDDDDDNDGIPDEIDNDDDNDGIPDSIDSDDDNDGIPDKADSGTKSKIPMRNLNDLDGDGIPNDKDDDDDNDGIPDINDTDDDNDGVPDVLDSDDDNDGIPDIRDKDSGSKPNDLDGDDKDDDDDDNDGIPDVEDVDDDNDGIPDDQEGKPLTNDLDGDGIPNDLDDDDDNDGIPDSEDDDDDNDGIPDAEDVDDDNDGIPDELDEGSRNANDLDGDGIPNDLDDDDDNDGIPDAIDNDDDNDGIPDNIDSDDDNDGISDTQENIVMEFSAPQICHDPATDNSEEDDDDEDVKCYTFSGNAIEIKASIDEHNERDDVEECIYPLDGFKCHIDKAWVKTQEQGCKPVIKCLLRQPYDDNSSLLFGTSCDGDEDNDGDDDRGDSTYYFYLYIRSLLDFFLLAALTMFNTIIVIATRDPSSGVGDFGRQLVWGAIGWIVFFNDDYEQPYFLFILLNTTAAIILLSPLKMNISPLEEWWKFKTTPQNFFSVAPFIKYARKCWLPFLVALGLGSLWSIIDSIDESHMIDIPVNGGDEPKKSVGLQNVWKTVLLAGDLLAVPALVFSKRIIEVIGTCKILVAAFLSLFIRYILLAIFNWRFWDIIEDLLLPTTLGLTWITLVLHFRDNLPRKVTALAQALPVIAHFGFGRFFGALIGIENDYDQLENDYEVIAGILFAISIVSIVLYRYREMVPSYIGQYIPALKPDKIEKVTTNGKGETDV
ncbi:serine-aspartate repeat-containing protein F-like isoform X2 [Topomyia yanbarensis]|uniref:serine-aspartate repeat-containing protein F-like isoform X2 n=1 Tax=Topomyia yanbarensis TaxID=2498891 RepID=UPI00273B20BB|nr:serine-aspartate repeat-containing protein F-like isoform X2 [Topomyia yanbarensis]